MDDDLLGKLGTELRGFAYDLKELADAPTSEAGPDRATGKRCIPSEVHVLVRFRGSVADLKSAGLRNVAVFEDPDGESKIADGDIAISRLGELAVIKHVVSVSGQPRFYMTLVLLGHTTRADQRDASLSKAGRPRAEPAVFRRGMYDDAAR